MHDESACSISIQIDTARYCHERFEETGHGTEGTTLTEDVVESRRYAIYNSCGVGTCVRSHLANVQVFIVRET